MANSVQTQEAKISNSLLFYLCTVVYGVYCRQSWAQYKLKALNMSGHNPNQTPEQPGTSGLSGQAGLTGTGTHVTPGSGTAGNILRKWDYIHIIYL